jgi:FkbM family methyltransferase
MAIAAWKRFEKTPRYQRAKVALKRLAGKELRLKPEIKVTCVESAGWQFDPSQLDEYSIVYSCGVGDDVDLDLAFIDGYGAQVHAFDPTPSAMDMIEKRDLPKQFRFHPWAVSGEDGTLTLYRRVKHDGSASTVMYTLVPEDSVDEEGITTPAYTIGSICKKLGHSRIDLLKLDIEGAEFAVLDDLLAGDLRPKQLLVEFHHRFAGIGIERAADMIKRLHDAGYRIFAISDVGREVSFLHQPDEPV